VAVEGGLRHTCRSISSSTPVARIPRWKKSSYAVSTRRSLISEQRMPVSAFEPGGRLFSMRPSLVDAFPS
jgi:hypothetical protein